MTDSVLRAGITRERYPLKARTLTVRRVEELSPGMRRIVVGGDELEDTLPYTRLGVADHVKLVIPDPVTGEVHLPRIGERGMERPAGIDLAIRDYTIRGFDPAAGELSLDFVLHDHGPAGRWAIAAKPGDRIGLLGPRGTTVQPDGYARYVIAADETALPATERWIAEAPQAAVLDVFVLVPDAAEERELPRHPGLRLHWLHRQAGDDLAEAVIAAVPDDDGSTYVWASAEATSVQPVRRHLREVAGFAREAIDVHGYWKLGVAGHQEPHGAPDAPRVSGGSDAAGSAAPN